MSQGKTVRGKACWAVGLILVCHQPALADDCGAALDNAAANGAAFAAQLAEFESAIEAANSESLALGDDGAVNETQIERLGADFRDAEDETERQHLASQILKYNQENAELCRDFAALSDNLDALAEDLVQAANPYVAAVDALSDQGEGGGACDGQADAMATMTDRLATMHESISIGLEMAGHLAQASDACLEQTRNIANFLAAQGFTE